MSFTIRNNRRNDKRIKSVIKGQKPTCIITVYPWESPSVLALMVLNLTKGSPYAGGNNAGDKAGAGRKPYVIDNDIVRCTVNKDKNSSSGGFSLILKRGNKGDVGQKVSDDQIDYLSSLSPGDWITVYMKSDGRIDPMGSTSDSGLKMLGIIENVRYVEIDDPSLGKPRLEYVITGRDFGKIFESDIYFNPVITSDPEFQKIMGAKFNTEAFNQFGNSGNKSPDKIIRAMLDFYVGGGLADASATSQQYYVPGQIGKLFGKGSLGAGSLPFYNILNKNYIGLQNHNSEGEFLGVSPLLGEIIMLSAPATGSVWQALQNYGNMSLNEFVVDLKKTQDIGLTEDGYVNYKLEPTIQFRQVPYSSKAGSETSPFAHGASSDLAKQVSGNEKSHFVNLPRHVIDSTDIKQKNVGKSDFERVNTITVVPSFFNSEPFTQAYRMAVNIPSVQRYGTKLLNVMTAYGAKQSEFLTHSTKCVALLTDWFMSAHLLYNGTIVTTGTDEFVEVGQNLLIADIDQLFHIEGVSYTYEINQADGGTIYNTEFRVSRGQRLEGGVTKFIDSNASLGTQEVYSTVISNTLENIRNNETTK